MIKKKIKLYYKILVQSFFKILYGTVLLTRNIDNLIKKEKIESTKFKSFKNKHYNLYKVKNARIYTDNNQNVAIIKKNFILPFVSFQQVKGNLRKPAYNSVIKIGTPSFLKRIKGRVFNLCQGGSGNNYFHFLFDIITKLKIYQEKFSLNEIDYFYVPGVKTWQKKILSLFEIYEDRLIDSSNYRHLKGTEIIAVDHPWYKKGFVQQEIQNLPEWIIFFLRDKFLKLKKKFKVSKKIFIDRSDSVYSHCKLINNQKVIEYLETKGFKSYQY